MPTFIHGKGASFFFNSVRYSSGIEEVSFPRSVDTAEVTTYGDNDRNYIAGLRGASISVTGIWASTYENLIAPLLGSTAASAFVFSPGSTAATNRKETGNAFITGYEVGAPVGDKVSMKIDFMVTGAVTSTKW